jgi:hypothetical protein
VLTHRLRTGAIAGLAIALVLALPSLSSASPQPRTDGPAPGFTHTQAKRILGEVRAAFAPKPQHAFGRGEVLPRTDLTMKLRDLRLARSALTRSERTAADQYLARPSLSSACTGTVVISGHFCVHYTAPGLLPDSNSATPDQAQLTADTLGDVWDREVGALGFRAPPSDGDEFFDVYLQDVGSQGLYGYCAPDNATVHSSSYCVLDNDFASSQFGGAAPINSLSVTAAHEFFHAIQFGYDVFEDIWFMEGTAVWAEEQVYPAINDYLQYLGYSAITHPRVPADYNGIDGTSDLFYRYGAVVFWKFLSERFGTPSIVRRVWEYADASQGSRYSLQAVTAALAEHGTSFARTFATFGAWNTKPRGSYGDRALFPSPAWWKVTSLTRSHRGTGSLGVVLDHLTNAAMLVRPGSRLPRRTRVRIIVDAPALARMSRALVQVRRHDGTITYVAVPLNANGDGSQVVAFDPRVVASVVVTLTNASTRMSSCGTDASDRYSCAGESADDGLDFAVRARLRLP